MRNRLDVGLHPIVVPVDDNSRRSKGDLLPREDVPGPPGDDLDARLTVVGFAAEEAVGIGAAVGVAGRIVAEHEADRAVPPLCSTVTLKHVLK